MSDSSATQQQNDSRPQSTKGKLLAPTNSNISQFIHSTVGAHRRRPLEDEEETSSGSSSSSYSDEDEESNRYFVFVLHFIRFLFICIFSCLLLKI